MRKQRLQTDLGPGPERLQPAASPVDTFVRTDAGQKLSRLAEGLSTLSPSLARLSDTVAQENAATQSAKGEQAARDLIEQNKTYVDAIKSGALNASDSPFYRLAFKEMMGRTAAQKYSAQLATNLADSNVAESTDPKDFDKFESDQRAQFLKDNFGDNATDTPIANAFGRMADNLVEGHRNSFAASASARMERDFGEGLHQEVFQGVTAMAGHASPEDIAKSVQLALDRAVAPGHNAGTANRAVVAAVVAAAQRMNDTSILKVLDSVVTNNNGAKLGATSYATQAVEQAENAIVGQQMSQWNHDQNIAAVAEKKQVEQAKMDLMGQILSSHNPSSLDLTEPLKAINKIDPGAVTDILNARDTIVRGIGRNDVDVIKNETADIWSGRGSRTRLIRLLGDGKINQQGFEDLNGELLKSEEAYRSEQSAGFSAQGRIFGDPVFEKEMTTFGGLFGNEFMMDPEHALRKHRATSELLRQWYQWRSGTGQDANTDDKVKWLNGTTESLRKQFASPNSISFADVPPAGPATEKSNKWQKEAILSSTALSDLSDHINAKTVTSTEAAFLAAYGLTTPEQVARFVETQRALINPTTQKK